MYPETIMKVSKIQTLVVASSLQAIFALNSSKLQEGNETAPCKTDLNLDVSGVERTTPFELQSSSGELPDNDDATRWIFTKKNRY